jgi:multiple sugar transport system substrate-binding protein
MSATSEDFWPGAMKSVTWEGKTYGIPTNNETMALHLERRHLRRAGLDPDEGARPRGTMWSPTPSRSTTSSASPATAWSPQNAGNTPYRFMPQLWGYGGGVFDEADPSPTYDGEIRLNSPESKRALQAAYDMYVRDKSVPTSALTNTAGRQPGAVHRRPARHDDLASVRLYVMLDLAEEGHRRRPGQGADRYRQHALRPDPDRSRTASAPWCSAAPTSTSSSPSIVEGGKVDEPAAKALICMWTSPEWSLKLAWAGSNPGNLNGFKTEWMKERLDTIKFLDVTTSMLPNGIPFPACPSAGNHEHHRPRHAAERPDRRHDRR